MAKSKKETDEKSETKTTSKTAPKFTLTAKNPRAKKYLGWIRNDMERNGEPLEEIDKAIEEFKEFDE